MRSSLKLARNVTLLLVAFVLPASAGSILSYNFKTIVSGVQSTTLTGSFIYDSSNGQFSTGSLSFAGNSAFGGLHGNYNAPESGLNFVLTVSTSGISLQYYISLNPFNLNCYSLWGDVSGSGSKGSFDYALPEGGSPTAYLISAGIVIFSGILLTGFRRRAAWHLES